MAYFKCTIGGASGDGVALIVECDSDFAGSVITADNGEDSFSDTCPSVAPYTVKFDGIPTGTYTISGVSGGVTITKQYTVLDYTAALHVIPNGSTVTPVNDIQIWLHCADIWDKSYTTLDEVLADASTLQALIASNNAADYMARSTEWASNVTANGNAMTYIGTNDYCAEKLLNDGTWRNAIVNSVYFENVLNVKVPTMTSNSAPRGTAFCSSTLGASNTGNQAWNAFDGNNATIWHSATSTPTNQSVGYVFPSNTKCYVATFAPWIYHNEARVNTYKIQGYNGSSWVDITDQATAIQTSTGVATNGGGYVGTKNMAVFSKNIATYQRYQLLVVNGNSYPAVCNLQFYGRASS